MHRSEITIDLGAARDNVRALAAAAGRAEVWAVVKADGYGHGALDVARAALGAGARAVCTATVEEALALRPELPGARLVVLGPATPEGVRAAREARLELAWSHGPAPEGVALHVKLDTGMGRWGHATLPPLPEGTVGVMSHLASADCDDAFTRLQAERFAAATAGLEGVALHLANSAGALRCPEARFDAVRCGIAIYGLSPFGDDPGAHGLRPVLSWRSHVAAVRRLAPGESAGYGRRFVASAPTWVGTVPVGYADGFRRDLTGTEVLVEGVRRRVVGTVSMDAFAVELDDGAAEGAAVTIVGDGLLLEEHARVAGTITYELACGIASHGRRARRTVASA